MLGAPDFLARGAPAAVLLRFQLLEVRNRCERAVGACADEAYGRSCSDFNELSLKMSSSRMPGRWWCRFARPQASEIAVRAVAGGAPAMTGVRVAGDGALWIWGRRSRTWRPRRPGLAASVTECSSPRSRGLVMTLGSRAALRIRWRGSRCRPRRAPSRS